MNEMTDMQFLQNYQGNESLLINRELRKRKPNSKFLEIENRMNKALSALNSLPNQTVYRVEQSICSFSEVHDWFLSRIGKIIGFPAFTSCSLNKDWMKDREFILEINTIMDTKAHSLLELNPKHPEKEVLFKSKSNFIIKSVDQMTKTIILTESKEKENEIMYENEGFFYRSRLNSDGVQSLSDLDLI